jgi:hypothetical protein
MMLICAARVGLRFQKVARVLEGVVFLAESGGSAECYVLSDLA